jgi:hypothetical protein
LRRGTVVRYSGAPAIPRHWNDVVLGHLIAMVRGSSLQSRGCDAGAELQNRCHSRLVLVGNVTDGNHNSLSDLFDPLDAFAIVEAVSASGSWMVSSFC